MNKRRSLREQGLGMVTSITLPVYNRSLAGNNQTLLGVVGTDLKISELDDMMPIRQLGPNGYGFVILATGYLISHPDLIAKYGWLTNPPPFDLLEIEYDCPEKEVVRTLIVNATKPGHIAVTAFVNVPDKRHVDNKTRIYYYAPVHLSSRFRVAIVLPDYSKFYLASVPHMDVSKGLSYLQTPASAVLLARWPYCKDMLKVSNTSTWQEDLLFTVANNYSSCDVDALQKLFSDAKITAEMNAQLLKSSYITRALSDVRAVFVATNNGLTRVFPSNFSSDFEGMTFVWNETYYRRALDNSELWMFSAAYQAPGNVYNDIEPPVVMVSKAVVVTIAGETEDQVYIPAVTGILLRYNFFVKVLNSTADQCFDSKDIKCFLLDDGAFVIASSHPDDKFKTGRFFGDSNVEPNVMAVLVQEGVYTKKSEFDYQAICQPKPPPQKATSSVGSVKSVLLPAFYDLLTLSWWTTKLSWFYSSMGLFQWIFANQQLTVDAQIDTTTASSQNESCVMEQAQYYLHYREIVANTTCGSCVSTISTAAVDETNLIFVKVTPYCRDCGRQFPSPSPKQVDDIYANNCNVTVRFRVRNPCYDYNPNEILECFGVRLLPNISLIFVGILLTWSWQRR